jgi:hypothetical protein
MKFYDIWMEGYAISGNSSGASFVGTIEAESFQEACENWYKKEDPENKYYNSERNTYWGCSLFDNQTDAIKSFG